MRSLGHSLRDNTRRIISRAKAHKDVPEAPAADTTSTPGVVTSQPTSSTNISGNSFQAQNVIMNINHSPDPLGHVPNLAAQRPQLKRCPPPVNAFTGRQDVLAQIRECFFDDSRKRHVFVLHGLGGAGKTQIALKFVEISQDGAIPRFSNVYFVDATTADTIVTDLRAIALSKGIAEDGTLDWLAGQQEEWLLLLNNADDPSFNLRDYFPRCSHGNILITTRNRDAVQHASDMRSSVRVSGMDPIDAANLLLKTSGIQKPHTKDTEELATVIVKELGHLPLAVVQAGAYIFQSDCGLEKYLDMYHERRGALLEEYRENIQKMDDYKWTIHTTWEISFNRLSEQSARFLQLCAFLHHDGISDAIFRNAASRITTYVPRFPPTALDLDCLSQAKEFLSTFQKSDSPWDTQKFMKMITEIRSYSLIDFDSANQTYSIHPLVHAWTRSTISHDKATHTCATWILGLSIIWEFKLEDYAFRGSLQSHIDTTIKGEDSVAVEFAKEFGLVYYEGGRLKEAEDMCLQVKDSYFRLHGAEHPDTLGHTGNLAITYRRQGRLKDAEELQVHVKEALLKVLGTGHPDTLWIMGDLASTYSVQGRWKEAEELQVQVKDGYSRLHGAEHPDTLMTTGNLSLTYQAQGRLKEAEELQVHVKEARLKLLGAGHPDTLWSMGNLASTYRDQGRWKEAEELLVQVKDGFCSLHGAQHPDTLKSMGSLVWTYWLQGRLKEAEELQVHVKEAYLKLLGAGHPRTLSIMRTLAFTYGDQGRWKEAEDLQVQVKDGYFRLYGPEHPNTLMTTGHLSLTYQAQGRWKEAEELQVHMKEACLRVLGPGHPDTLWIMGSLASTYSAQGRWKEAEELQIQVKDGYFKLHGAEHPDTLMATENLSLTYRCQGRLKEAEELQVHVDEARLKFLRAGHSDTLWIMRNLALSSSPQGRWKDAEGLQVQVNDRRLRRRHEAYHPDTLPSVRDLASTYRPHGSWWRRCRFKFKLLVSGNKTSNS